jgi:hypothetical protein
MTANIVVFRVPPGSLRGLPRGRLLCSGPESQLQKESRGRSLGFVAYNARDAQNQKRGVAAALEQGAYSLRGLPKSTELNGDKQGCAASGVFHR